MLLGSSSQLSFRTCAFQLFLPWLLMQPLVHFQKFPKPPTLLSLQSLHPSLPLRPTVGLLAMPLLLPWPLSFPRRVYTPAGANTTTSFTTVSPGAGQEIIGSKLIYFTLRQPLPSPPHLFQLFLLPIGPSASLLGQPDLHAHLQTCTLHTQLPASTPVSPAPLSAPNMPESLSC